MTITDRTLYECLLCDYREEEGQGPLIRHLIEEHGLDEGRVTQAEGCLIWAEDGPEHFKNVYRYGLDGRPIARVTHEGPRVSLDEMPYDLP